MVVDINYNKPDSVYPFKPTPLCVAARYIDLQMCKYLVEHGADVTITERMVCVPYSIASLNVAIWKWLSILKSRTS